MSRPPFPAVLSNSLRSDFLTCPRKFELSHIHHWKPKHTSIHLHAGGAFAKGMEVTRKAFYQQGLSSERAIELGWRAVVEAYAEYTAETNDIKTAERMASALLYYFTAFSLDTDFLTPLRYENGPPSVEFSFVLPLDIAHPETGDPILLGGRFDMLAQHTNGDLYVVDEKTTSQLGSSWVDSWKLDSQFTEYCWAARQYGHHVSGAVIRGISILKNGHAHAQSIQMRPQWMIERWYAQLLRDIRRMVDAWESGMYDFNLSHGCKLYGGCQFRLICASANPTRWLEADFVQRPYQPYGA